MSIKYESIFIIIELWSNFWQNKRNFKPKLEKKLGEGGQAKVFKAKFHRKDVAMKYIPLDHVKDSYDYGAVDYGCHEFWYQEEFFTDRYNHLRFHTIDDLVS